MKTRTDKFQGHQNRAAANTGSDNREAGTGLFTDKRPAAVAQLAWQGIMQPRAQQRSPVVQRYKKIKSDAYKLEVDGYEKQAPFTTQTVEPQLTDFGDPVSPYP